ncbi:hypothetical protein HRG_012580 [Hirsutella rhossiliensis]
MGDSCEVLRCLTLRVELFLDLLEEDGLRGGNALGYPLSQSQIRACVVTVLKQQGCDSRLGRHWVEKFIQRHPELRSKVGRRQEANRFDSFTPKVVHWYFDVRETEYGWIKPENTVRAFSTAFDRMAAQFTSGHALNFAKDFSRGFFSHCDDALNGARRHARARTPRKRRGGCRSDLRRYDPERDGAARGPALPARPDPQPRYRRSFQFIFLSRLNIGFCGITAGLQAEEVEQYGSLPKEGSTCTLGDDMEP